jgi:hypothetical protein
MVVRMSSILFDGKTILFLFAAYSPGLLFYSEDGGITFLRIVDKLSPGYAASNFSRQYFSCNRRRDLNYPTSFHFRNAADQ